MNRKTRFGIGASLAAATLIAASATYAATSGDQGRPSSQFAPHIVTIPTSTENGHVSVTPCRAVDTRHGGGPVGTGAIRVFKITGSTTLAAQGGSASGCGIPAYAAAATLNVTVTGTTAGGYLSVYPGGPKPSTSTVNWSGKGQTLANGATIKLSATGQLSVYASKATNVIIDVTGYDATPIYAIINDNNGTPTAPELYSKTSRVGTISYQSAGYYTIGVAGSTNFCAATATMEAGVDGTAEAYSSTGQVNVHTYNQAGTLADLGRYIDVTVHC